MGLNINYIEGQTPIDEDEKKGLQISSITTREELHSKMFDSVWKWAGKYRTTNKNIGVEWQFISVSLKQLLDDCKFWIENKTYPEDEISVRFSHRLVSIHCFPNGNGRHSRLMADVIISHIFNKPVFSWGSEDLVKHGEVRKKYINVIQEADKGNIKSLLEFARL